MACRAAYLEALEAYPELARSIFDRLNKFERTKLLKYTTTGDGSSSGAVTPRSYASTPQSR